MSTVLFSKTLVGKINAIITRFWWVGVQDDNPTNPIAFRSWDDICQPKENGGLGIRDLYTVNKSLFTQAAWNIVTNKNPFLTSVLKAKYYHNTSFWTANTTGPRSIFWSSILQVETELCTNTIYQIHVGNNSIWSTPWCPLWNSIHDHLLLPVTNIPLHATISNHWLPNSRSWNVQLISNVFDNQAVQAITTVQAIPSEEQDILRWTPSKTGQCTTKNVYRHLGS